MGEKLKKLLAEYGTVALVVYLVLFAATLVGFWSAIQLGWRPSSAGGNVGALAAAYLATKVTQPLRIAATLFLTPFVAAGYERVVGRGRRSAGAEIEDAADEPVVHD
jgi:hypothetical protein